MCDPADVARGEGVRLVSLRAAAARLSVSCTHAINLIERGELAGFRHYPESRLRPEWRVVAASVDAYIGRKLAAGERRG